MRELTFTEAAREGLSEEMAEPSVFVVGEGIGARGGNFNTTTGLFERHGAERLRDTPITERGFTGLCTGAAMAGARPVVDYMFFDFALDALGELLNQTSKIQYMSDGASGCRSSSGAAWAWGRGGHPPLGQLLPDLHEHPGVPRRGPDHAGRRQGAPEDGDPVRRPRRVHGAPLAPPDPRGRCRTGSTWCRSAARPSPGPDRT